MMAPCPATEPIERTPRLRCSPGFPGIQLLRTYDRGMAARGLARLADRLGAGDPAGSRVRAARGHAGGHRPVRGHARDDRLRPVRDEPLPQHGPRILDGHHGGVLARASGRRRLRTVPRARLHACTPRGRGLHRGLAAPPGRAHTAALVPDPHRLSRGIRDRDVPQPAVPRVRDRRRQVAVPARARRHRGQHRSDEPMGARYGAGDDGRDAARAPDLGSPARRGSSRSPSPRS